MKCNRCNKVKTESDSEGKPHHIIRKEQNSRCKNDENDMNDSNKINKLKLKSKSKSFKVPKNEPPAAPFYPESSKKVHSERMGDWVCSQCHNLNFSFRKVWNRCKITREMSELSYMPMPNIGMDNVSNYGPMINFSIPSMPSGMQYDHNVTQPHYTSSGMPMSNGSASTNYEYSDHSS